MDRHTRSIIDKKKKWKWHNAFVDGTLHRKPYIFARCKSKEHFWWKPDTMFLPDAYRKDQGSLRTMWRNKLSDPTEYEDLCVCNRDYKKSWSYLYYI